MDLLTIPVFPVSLNTFCPSTAIVPPVPETTEVITEIVPKYDDSGDITTTTTPTEKDDDGTNKVKEENQRELIKQANLYDSDVVVRLCRQFLFPCQLGYHL